MKNWDLFAFFDEGVLQQIVTVRVPVTQSRARGN
jgi:hypothetical protein